MTETIWTKKKNANQRKNKLRKLANTHDQLENTLMNPYPKFYSMKFPRIEIESEIDVIAVDKYIK